MNRPVAPVLVAILFVTSLFAVPGGALGAAEASGDPRPVQAAAVRPPQGTAMVQDTVTTVNTTRMVHLDRVETRGFGTVSLSVTDAIRTQTGTTEIRLDRYAVEKRLAMVAPENRTRVLRAALNRSAARIRNLAEREREARKRLRTGSIGIDRYLAVLGSVNREIRAVEGYLEHLEQITDAEAIEDRVNALQTNTARYIGPVSNDLGNALVRGATSDRVWLAVAEEGFVVAAIREGEYVREITLTTARDRIVGGINLDAAQARISELYPWAWAHKGDVSINTVGEDVFRFQLSHDHGELTALLDTSAGNVYREIQQKTLARLPVAPGPAATSENLTLSISALDPGTPLRVQVTNATGARVTASVWIDGTSVGRTGPSSGVWALTPAGNFTVTARAGNRTVELVVDPR
ncbi:MAG: hypothetical protein ABEJ60_01030 [Halodesulfurarchaeum sp.]